jgi:site-specific DNA-methyltransferase (adenine-specific)
VTKDLHILTGDATKLNLPSNSVDLIITHPPYLGVDVQRYGGNPEDQINNSFNRKKMMKLLDKATREMFRILKPTGSLIIANGPTDNIDIRFVMNAIDNVKFIHAGYVIQDFYDQKTETKAERITSSHTIWHHFIKGGDIYFNNFKVREYNNSIWPIEFNNENDPVDKEMSKDFHIWDVMNKEIPKRFIEMFSKKGHVVLDPFGGSAMVAVTAVELGRIGITNDISEKQTEAAHKRAELTLGK